MFNAKAIKELKALFPNARKICYKNKTKHYIVSYQNEIGQFCSACFSLNTGDNMRTTQNAIDYGKIHNLQLKEDTANVFGHEDAVQAEEDINSSGEFMYFYDPTDNGNQGS